MANLVDLEVYKVSEKIESSKEDARIASLITSVSQLVKTYCGNSIVDYAATPKTEDFHINWNTTFVQLTESPILGVISLKERETFSSAYTTLNATDYYVDTKTDTIHRVNANGVGKSFPTGPSAVQVIYEAGYADCPPDLQLAVIDLITYYMKDEHKARQTIQGASIQNSASSSQRNNVAFPDHIKRVLDLYKNF